MNSEELEQSLRTEFESYLKKVLDDMRQEVSQFQQKIDTELESHKSHLDGVFKDFSARLETDKELDEGFKESVVEHLRLARDEGATITAQAIAEAEELTKAQRKETEAAAEVPAANLKEIRDAIYEISSQNSQSAILKALIDHAAKFTPRGAFFVVKNQHFVGWRVFGKEENQEEGTISEIVFPVSSSTMLGDSVRSLSVIESVYGNYSDDPEYLLRLDFGKPAKMFAIPLIARGRGVAAIYADNGEDGEKVNLEALETLVSVAGLTVELLAAAQNNKFSRGMVRTVTHSQPETVSEEVEEPVSETVESHQPEETETSYQEETAEPVSSQYFAQPAEPEEMEEEVETVEDEVEAVETQTAYEMTEEEETVFGVSEEAEEAEEETVFGVSDSFVAEETAEEEEAVEEETYAFSSDEEEAVEEETYTLSANEEDSLESVQQDFAAYDDDLIEEVQTQPETVEVAEEESEPVYEDAEVIEMHAAEEEFQGEEPVSAVEEEMTESETEEVIPEYTDSFSAPVEYDMSDEEEVEETVVESLETEDSFTISSPSEYPFETNQDLNSSPVQFAEPVEETFEAAEMPSMESVEESIEDVSASQQDAAFETFHSPESEPEETVSAAEESVEESVEETVEEPVEEVAQPVAPPSAKTRFSDRNVDLPIEVSEEERRLHNDARRFARLLVSEIKLYNEQKVKEGRDAGDLYDRLREAIDRSREMYDKRVQPSVVQRFDYFHYEVVNNLAEGEESKLGSGYPGATV
ncbi:MAG: hypothetical protein R2747_01820 [Pyrinomonadaceae bacterium]